MSDEMELMDIDNIFEGDEIDKNHIYLCQEIQANARAYERAENVKKLKAMEERCRTISRRDAKDQNLEWAKYFSHNADVFKEATKEIEEQN